MTQERAKCNERNVIEERIFIVNPSPEAHVKVHAIAERARALGWTEQELFGNRGKAKFPFGQDYGVICYLTHRPTDEIIDVTTESITLGDPKSPQGHRQFRRSPPQPHKEEQP